MRAPPTAWWAVLVALLCPAAAWWAFGALPALRLSPPEPTSIDDLYALLHPPGPAEVRWTRNGVPVPSLDGRQVVPASMTTKGEVWRVSVGDDAVEATVGNLAPHVVGWLAHDPPRNDQDLELVLEGNPIDGDPLSYRIRWTVDGVPAPAWDDQQAVPAASTESGQTWTVEVVPTDGELDGDSLALGAVIDGRQAWGVHAGEAASGRAVTDFVPTPFEAGLVGLAVLGLVGRFLGREATPEAPSERGLGWVFAAVTAALVLLHLQLNPLWVPTGSDADSWYQSVLALTQDVPYPPNRWPLYGWMTAALDHLSPDPTFVAAQGVSLLATAAALTALFRLGQVVFGLPGALAVVLATLAFPQVPNAAGWTNAYALWAAGAVVAVAGLADAARGRTGGFVMVGLGVTVVLAAMEKGLPLGLMLAGLGGLSWLAVTGPGRGLRLAWLAAPLTAVAIAYAAFPIDLMTLDAQVVSPYLEQGVAESGGGQPPPPPPPPGGAPGGEVLAPVGGEDLTGDGYVFGQSMAPSTVFTTFSRLGSSGPGLQVEKLARTWQRLHVVWPSLGGPLLLALVIGGGIGVVGSVWRGRGAFAGWAGVAAVCAGVLPSVAAEFNLRFLHPMLLVVPLLLVAPVAVLTAARAGPWRWLPLGFLPVALLPGSPWTEMKLSGEHLTRVAGPDTVGVTVYHHLAESFPDAELEVTVPASIALVALDGRAGRYHATDRRFHETSDAVELDPSRHVLRIKGGAEGTRYRGLSGRKVVASWPIPTDPAGVDRADSAGAGLTVELLGPGGG